MCSRVQTHSEKSICRFSGNLRHIELLFRIISSGNTEAVSQTKLRFPASNEILKRTYGSKKEQIDPAALEPDVLRFKN